MKRSIDAARLNLAILSAEFLNSFFNYLGCQISISAHQSMFINWKRFRERESHFPRFLARVIFNDQFPSYSSCNRSFLPSVLLIFFFLLLLFSARLLISKRALFFHALSLLVLFIYEFDMPPIARIRTHGTTYFVKSLIYVIEIASSLIRNLTTIYNLTREEQ